MNFKLDMMGNLKLMVSRNWIASIVRDMSDFVEFAHARGYMTDAEEYPIDMYFRYYDWKSQELAKDNALSRGVTVAAKNETELLLNNAEYRQQKAAQFANFD